MSGNRREDLKGEGQSRPKHRRLDEGRGDTLLHGRFSTNSECGSDLCHGSIVRIKLNNFLYVFKFYTICIYLIALGFSLNI